MNMFKYFDVCWSCCLWRSGKGTALPAIEKHVSYGFLNGQNGHNGQNGQKRQKGAEGSRRGRRGQKGQKGQKGRKGRMGMRDEKGEMGAPVAQIRTRSDAGELNTLAKLPNWRRRRS